MMTRYKSLFDYASVLYMYRTVTFNVTLRETDKRRMVDYGATNFDLQYLAVRGWAFQMPIRRFNNRL